MCQRILFSQGERLAFPDSKHSGRWRSRLSKTGVSRWSGRIAATSRANRLTEDTTTP
jgi:hypothetical protein